NRRRPSLQSLRPNVASPAICHAAQRRDECTGRDRWCVHRLPHRGGSGTASITPDELHHGGDWRTRRPLALAGEMSQLVLAPTRACLAQILSGPMSLAPATRRSAVRAPAL